MRFTTLIRRFVIALMACGLASTMLARTADAQVAEMAPIVEVDVSTCGSEAAINSAVGQSFRLPPGVGLALDGIEIWIAPSRDHETRYELALIEGEGLTGRLLGTSPTIAIDASESGEQAGWHGFPFEDVSLRPDRPYTFAVVSRSPSSGTLAECENTYANGLVHRPGLSSDSSADIAFRVHGRSQSFAAQGPDLAPPPEPRAPVALTPLAGATAQESAANRKAVMPLGDSITDMPASMGAAWGGYRKVMANDANFNRLFIFVGAYGVYQYQQSASPWDMPWDQRYHCGWSGATMDGWGVPGSSISQNFWLCKASAAQVDYVLMHAGTNDLRQVGDPNLIGDTAAQKAVDLIEAIMWNTPFETKVLVAKLIPQTGNSAGYNPNVIAYNEHLETLVTARKEDAGTSWYWLPRVKIVDMYKAFHTWTNDKPQDALLDGLHPNLWGNQIMAYEWRAALYSN